MVMSIHNLKILNEVAKNNSITKTAEQLYISQPAVSKAVKMIEDELQVKIFYRDKRNGLKLTDVGQKIILLAREMILCEEKMHQISINEKQLLSGKLKIASVSLMNWVFIIPVIARFKEKYPCVDIELIEGSTNEVKKMVADCEVDIGITISPFEDFDYRMLYHDYMVCISNQPLNINEWDLTKEKEALLICRAGYESIISLLKDRRATSSSFHMIEGIQTLRHIVAQGLELGIISELGLQPYKKAFYSYPVIPTLEMDYACITNDFNDLTPAASTFMEMLQEMKEECLNTYKNHL